MSQAFDAIFDGNVLRPIKPVALKPNTRVRLTAEIISEGVDDKPLSFLDVARKANLQGPPDWASNLDYYLYGHRDSAWE